MSIQLAPSRDEWIRLRECLTAFCEEHCLSEPLRQDLQLVCEEWFMNIVIHGYQEGEIAAADAKPILVELQLRGGDQIVVRFTDAAPAFNPLQHRTPDVSLPAEERPIGGLGIYLIKSKMDHCLYNRSEDKNEFTMIKGLRS